MKKTGVVLLAHGSRGANANDGVFEVVAALRAGTRHDIVEVGFMQRNFPTIEEAAKACILQGANDVLLIPYFLHVGLHLQHDLPEKVELLRALHPEVRFALGRPLAHHPRLLDIVLDRIAECRADLGGLAAVTTEPMEMPPPADGPSLRTGYTTGACAAAAAKAAAQVLLSRKRVIEVEILLPAGRRARLPIGRCEIHADGARCSVVKDAGDDPDVTNGAEICASVQWTAEPGVVIEGGEGVGVVTKPGLGLPVGSAAINPVPRRMIQDALAEVLGGLPSERGVRVVVTVPAGEAYARRTLNRRLGIVGGISILGTTGIVVPFSTEAYRAAIAQALAVAVAAGCREVVLTTGRRTERFAQQLLDLPEEAYVQAGDHIGSALEECVRGGVERVIVAAMAGKLAKLAAGHLQTHVSRSTVDLSFLAEVAAGAGADQAALQDIGGANTARHFVEIVRGRGLEGAFPRLCSLAAEGCRVHAGDKLAVECLLLDYEGGLLGRGGSHG